VLQGAHETEQLVSKYQNNFEVDEHEFTTDIH